MVYPAVVFRKGFFGTRSASELACTLAVAIGCVGVATAPAGAQTRPAANASGSAPQTATRAAAQTAARTGRLFVTVVDPLGAVLPNATVRIAGIEDATRRATLTPAPTSDRGVATFERLVLGHYSVSAEFPGFDPAQLKDVRVRAGDNRETLTLPLRRLTDSVTVGVDQQEAAADRSSALGTALTREQIDALSEDPNELRNQLLGMAGDQNATFRVDSFEGADLPPKSMIKSVRITRDQFSAENHYAGGISIEIITQPGVGPLRGNIGSRFHDSSLDGQNELVGARPPGQDRSYNGGLSGSLLKDRASFSVSMSGTNSYTAPVINAVTPEGRQAEVLRIHAPSNNAYVYGQADYALTKDQTLRFGVTRQTGSRDNQGVGDLELGSRAYSSDNQSTTVRLQEVGPLGRRFFINTRFSLSLANNASQSAVEAPTIVILGSEVDGGAQQTGSTHSQVYSLASDLDYVRGRQSWKAGVQIDGTRFNTDANSNYLGTFTFESMDAYLAGQPRSFTQRIGDPVIRYSNVQAGLYLLDDIRLRKNLTFTAGVRYEIQTHLSDHNNLAPRVGFTWAPFKSGKTTLRTSFGIFHDWLSTNTYEQTLRLDGFRQQSINIANPPYPDIPDAASLGTTSPTDRYLLVPGLQMPSTARLSAGIGQTINSHLSVNFTYAYSRGSSLFVGQNLNIPVDGVRPDSAFANVIEATSDGRSVQHSASLSGSLTLFKPSTADTKKLFDWKRQLQVFGGYGVNHAMNDTDGAFSVPATNSLADNWGPALNDVRNSVSFGIGTGALRNLSVSLQANYSSPRPLNITTGHDDNGDLLFTDRPAGVGRNSARNPAQWNSYGFISYSIPIGSKQMSSGGGVRISSVNGVLTANVTDAQTVPRYRLNIGVSLQNLTNHANTTLGSVMSASNFLQPVSAYGWRTAMFNVSLSF
jgi:hypothetical protein